MPAFSCHFPGYNLTSSLHLLLCWYLPGPLCLTVCLATTLPCQLGLLPTAQSWVCLASVCLSRFKAMVLPTICEVPVSCPGKEPSIPSTKWRFYLDSALSSTFCLFLRGFNLLSWHLGVTSDCLLSFQGLSDLCFWFCKLSSFLIVLTVQPWCQVCFLSCFPLLPSYLFGFVEGSSWSVFHCIDLASKWKGDGWTEEQMCKHSAYFPFHDLWLPHPGYLICVKWSSGLCVLSLSPPLSIKCG